VVRLVVPQFSISRMLTRVISYHMLSRFLLDQTRPLGLPEHVLNPMRDARWRSGTTSPRATSAGSTELEDAWTVSPAPG
jgi:hypothetical protein